MTTFILEPPTKTKQYSIYVPAEARNILIVILQSL